VLHDYALYKSTFTLLTYFTLGPKFGRGLGRGRIPQSSGPLLVFATVESNDFKFGTQLGSRE